MQAVSSDVVVVEAVLGGEGRQQALAVTQRVAQAINATSLVQGRACQQEWLDKAGVEGQPIGRVRDPNLREAVLTLEQFHVAAAIGRAVDAQLAE